MKHLTSQKQFDTFDDVHTLMLVMIAAVLFADNTASSDTTRRRVDDGANQSDAVLGPLKGRTVLSASP
jgi:hypothetical protein